MSLTRREQELLHLIRESPMSTPEELALRLGTTRSAVNVHVSHLVKKGALCGRGYLLPDAEPGGVVVVGGANMDFKSRILASAIPGTSNPGRTSPAAGGVGRNIAENLGRLGVKTHLISALGRDALGEQLLRTTEAAGVNVQGVLSLDGEATGTYTAVLDQTGELIVAVADMRVMERLTAGVLEGRRSLLLRASWVVVDGNLPEATLQALLERCAGASRVLYEPVSVPKAVHLLRALKAGLAPYGVTPNLDELGALIGEPVANRGGDIRQAALKLHAQGIDVVWVRRGRLGSLLSLAEQWYELPALPAQVTDVTGAGDAMLAAFVAALTRGQDELTAARWGHAAAALTVESPFTVLPDLTLQAVEARAQAHPPSAQPLPSPLRP